MRGWMPHRTVKLPALVKRTSVLVPLGCSPEWTATKAAALERAGSVLAQPRLQRWSGAVHDVPLQWPALVAGLVRAAVDEVTVAAAAQVRA